MFFFAEHTAIIFIYSYDIFEAGQVTAKMEMESFV